MSGDKKCNFMYQLVFDSLLSELLKFVPGGSQLFLQFRRTQLKCIILQGELDILGKTEVIRIKEFEE